MRYGRGYTFVAGHFLDEEILALGYVYLDCSSDEVTISGGFGVMLRQNPLFGNKTLNAEYDLAQKSRGANSICPERPDYKITTPKVGADGSLIVSAECFRRALRALRIQMAHLD